MKKKINQLPPSLLYAVAFLIVLGAGIFWGNSLKQEPQRIIVKQPITLAGTAPLGTPFQSTATTGVIAVVGTSGTDTAVLLATTSNRIYASFVNDCSSVVYLTLDDVPSGNANIVHDIRLNANGGSWEINQNNLYTGAVRATSTAVCDILVTESTNQ